MKRWPTKPLGELILPTEQRDPRLKPAEEFSYVDIAGIDNEAKAIAATKRIVGAEAPSRARKVIRNGDVIVSTVRPNLNAVALVPTTLDNQICSTGFSVLRPSDEVLSGYLFAFTRSPFFIDSLVARTTGANYPAVNDGEVKGVPVPVPPLAEQERIVKLLDEADELRKLRAVADRRTATIIPALFHEMFGDPFSSTKGSPVVPVEEAGRVQLGRQRAPKYQTGKFTRPYVRVANVFEDEIDVSDLLSMDFDKRDFEQYRLKHGDILLNEGQSTELVGRPAMWRNEVHDCCFQNTLVRFQADKERVLPDFALAVFLAYFREGKFSNISSKTSNVAHLGAGRFAKMPFPLPPLSVQKKFAARVTEFRAMRAEQATSHLCIEALFQSLLHRAFQGEL